MPRATNNPSKTFRRDLKSLPEGYVILRKLTYGESLRIQELTQLSASMANRAANGSQEFKMKFDPTATQVINFKSVVEHNLEDEGGRKLDLTSVKDLSQLDADIGLEIQNEIDDLNSIEVPDSPLAEKSSSLSSPQEKPKPATVQQGS